jgi:hypothetical protein
MKDLQRQISSLQRLKTVMADGFDHSYKNITLAFEEFRKWFVCSPDIETVNSK